MRGRDTTSGRPAGRSGVLLSLILLAGCDAVGGGATIELDDGQVSLPAGAEVHDITIRGAGATDSVAPAAVQASPGDAVRFTVEDRRTHAIAFVAEELPPAAREFLEESLQLRGPPLVEQGAAWVISLEDAPPGRYPFICRSHDARGMIVVEPEG